MKKTLLVLGLIIAFATASFAVSFMTAPGIGVGRITVLGMYATLHQGNIANNGAYDNWDPAVFDVTSLGVRAEYGVLKNLDVLAEYTMDSMPNVKYIDAPVESGKQLSGNTMGLGVKYTLPKDLTSFMPVSVDTAVAFGYETGSVAVKSDYFSSASIGNTAMTLAGIISKKMDNLVPYGGISYKILSKTLDKKITGRDFGAIGGNSLGFNLGCAIGIAQDQAILVEYNTENQHWAEAKKGAAPGNKIEENAVSVSGLSLGYAYLF